MKNQRGIAQILVLLLLIGGIGLGAYLIQQRTNIFPHAENNAPRIDTGSCRDNPDDAKAKVDELNKQTSGENFYYKWQAFCSNSCSQNSDCPKNEDDPDRVNPKDSNWCYGFGDGTNKCLKLVAVNKSDNQPAKTTTGKDPTRGSSTDSKTGSSGTSTTTSGTGSTAACTTDDLKKITTTYYDAKVAQRYARYTAIMKGAKEYCVQADLGLDIPAIPPLREDSKDSVVKNGRLYLCSGKNNTKEKLDLVWRVISDEGVHIRESSRPNPNSEDDVMSVMRGFIGVAKDKLGLK